ncbi:MAG: ABC transporter ATP-binding protein, partial [Clostridia bacterium]|nr:ABC transporter ATP-binding protein [Clostridia bacterium]
RAALNTNYKDSTKIIITQRISSIMYADQILVIDEGKIIGLGKHEELIKNCEIYQEISASQLGGGSNGSS